MLLDAIDKFDLSVETLLTFKTMILGPWHTFVRLNCLRKDFKYNLESILDYKRYNLGYFESNCLLAPLWNFW